MTAAKKRENARRARIRRMLPHQVALPNDLCCMENFDLIERFCSRFDPRPETLHVIAVWPNRKQEDFRLFCFATRDDAEVFATHFAGVHFDPDKDREGGRIGGVWRRSDEWRPIERCGPLELPRFFREYGR